MLDFDLGEMAETIRSSTERFAADRIAPVAAEIDASDRFPIELWPEMGALGLHGITVEEEWGKRVMRSPLNTRAAVQQGVAPVPASS